MSDFDEVLERLLGDPGFKAQLAADPGRALAGYHLSPDELDILQTQLGDAGGQRHVEQRTSKASMFGVFSSIGSGLGDVLHGGHGGGVAHTLGSGPGAPGGGAGADMGQRMHEVVEQQYGGRHAAVEPADVGPGSSIDHAVQDVGSGRHAVSEVSSSSSSHHTETSGTVYRASTYTGGLPQEPSGAAGAAAGLAGHHEGGHGSGLGAGLDDIGRQPGQGAGAVDGPAGHYEGGHGSGLGAGLDDIGREQGQGAGAVGGLAGRVHGQVPGAAPTDGYHTRVDWDGDGRWDQHTYVNRPDGGVDIVVDADGDGRAEFIGHDTDRDGLINSSEVDTDRDGTMDARYEDVNGDGWLDRRTR
ncbi:hypothetical protein Dvina_06640 [Dactylosporangium vinaceum]|uniref:EF-hand domain-containing protein n=1 Tax=Dactylosporangium vinaceum TaxID=53362 RepID=A0ABV5M6A6_9ACTN|nr:hypothetical protein [Dactylosporangium vinaceum]UAB97794.1 hypothetical protein Dvina_06640 [Dactylosporangium vinaceum]